MFVCLNMEVKDVVDRLKTRHKGHEGMVDMLKVTTVLPFSKSKPNKQKTLLSIYPTIFFFSKFDNQSELPYKGESSDRSICVAQYHRINKIENHFCLIQYTQIKKYLSIITFSA